jgi:predicted membrane protein
VILIIIGLLIGIRSRFKSVGWLVLVLLGGFFLVDNLPGFHFMRYYSFPVGIIIVGLFLVFRASVSRSHRSERYANRFGSEPGNTAKATEIFSGQEQYGSGSSEDYFDLTAIFGSVKRKIFSKTFKGGQSTNIFGGTEIDLSRADIEGVVVIDVVQVFGGVTIVAPANWEVKPELTSIFGGVEDKRNSPAEATSNKKLVITGTSLFGGVEIKSY